MKYGNIILHIEAIQYPASFTSFLPTIETLLMATQQRISLRDYDILQSRIKKLDKLIETNDCEATWQALQYLRSWLETYFFPFDSTQWTNLMDKLIERDDFCNIGTLLQLFREFAPSLYPEQCTKTVDKVIARGVLLECQLLDCFSGLSCRRLRRAKKAWRKKYSSLLLPTECTREIMDRLIEISDYDSIEQLLSDYFFYMSPAQRVRTLDRAIDKAPCRLLTQYFAYMSPDQCTKAWNRVIKSNDFRLIRGYLREHSALLNPTQAITILQFFEHDLSQLGMEMFRSIVEKAEPRMLVEFWSRNSSTLTEEQTAAIVARTRVDSYRIRLLVELTGLRIGNHHLHQLICKIRKL
jgi:hypothetical protein